MESRQVAEPQLFGPDMVARRVQSGTQLFDKRQSMAAIERNTQ